MVPSGGSSFWEEKTCNFGKLWYNHLRLWVGCRFCSGVRETSLTYVYDPCWNWGRRLPAEEENFLVSADSSKTESEKPSENRVNAIPGKVNPKWS